MKIVFLNGPPRSGKDYAAELLARALPGRVRLDKFARVLKEDTHRRWGIDAAANHFESRKDEPSSAFDGMTPREAYIQRSEEEVKPEKGADYYGRALLSELLLLSGVDYVVISDSGFLDEAVPLIRYFGPHNCRQVRLHRAGTSFLGDSRSYWDGSRYGLQSFEVLNPGLEYAPDLFLALLGYAVPEIRHAVEW